VKHHCHARNCSVGCKPECLMCLGHWRRVPRKLQRAVWDSYRPGQCDDRNPSEEWHVAADAAIAYVAILEGLPIRWKEAEALSFYGYGHLTPVEVR
jgi:hypothetical protein